MQILKSRKISLFATLTLLAVLFIMTVSPDAANAVNCMCDCYEVPGSCGGTISTVVENCNIIAADSAACAGGGCNGKLTGFNCLWTF